MGDDSWLLILRLSQAVADPLVGPAAWLASRRMWAVLPLSARTASSESPHAAGSLCGCLYRSVLLISFYWPRVPNSLLSSGVTQAFEIPFSLR